MNKDIKGLLVYIFIFVIIFCLVLCLAEFVGESFIYLMISSRVGDKETLPFFQLIYLCSFICTYSLFGLISLGPAILTIYAIVAKLSKYLERFFTNYLLVLGVYITLFVINIISKKYLINNIKEMVFSVYSLFFIYVTSVFVTLTIYNLILFIKQIKRKKAENNE